MLNLKITIEDGQLVRMLESLDTAHSPEALAEFIGVKVGTYLQERAKLRFRNEGDDVVGKWAPLSQTTNVFRQSAGYPAEHPINHRTGRLENYITGTKVGSRPTSYGAMLTFPANPPSGETERKLRTAQYGRANPRTPARPVLGINETDMAYMTSALHEYIATAARGGSLR